MTVTLEDCLFDLNYMALALGVSVQQGGLSVKEEELTAAVAGSLTLTEEPVAVDGSLIGWYKKPTDNVWSVGTITGQTMTIVGSQANEVYCVKYFYMNENADSITIKAQYVPSELHVVLIYDLYAADINVVANQERYGRLIVDIPRLQMAGSQELSLDASSTSTVSLTGSALAVNTSNSCEEDPYYGTMTQEIYGASWKDNVVAIAVQNGDVDLAQSGTETLIVRAVYSGNRGSDIKDNSNFTFAVEGTPASTATGTNVDASGVITAGTTAGTCVISVTLKDAPVNVESAYVLCTVT